MYTQASHLHWCEVDECVVLLDQRAGSYYALDKADSVAWRSFLTALPDLALPDPARNAGERADLPKVITDAIANGWLVSLALAAEESPPLRRSRPAFRILFALRALQCLRSVAKQLDRRGFDHAYEAAKALDCPEPPVVSLESAGKAFMFAERFFLTAKASEDCLVRSLALYTFLVRSGFRASHRIGVRRYPFLAHAWVEVDGRSVLDVPEKVRDYTLIATLPCANGKRL